MKYTVKCEVCSWVSDEFEYEVLPAYPIEMAREYIVCLACCSGDREIVEVPE